MHVIEALNLVAADEHEPPSSDPYVKLKLSGLPKGNVLQQALPNPSPDPSPSPSPNSYQAAPGYIRPHAQ